MEFITGEGFRIREHGHLQQRGFFYISVKLVVPSASDSIPKPFFKYENAHIFSLSSHNIFIK